MARNTKRIMVSLDKMSEEMINELVKNKLIQGTRTNRSEEIRKCITSIYSQTFGEEKTKEVVCKYYM